MIFQSLFSIFFRGLSVEERAQQRKDKNRERMSKLRQPKLSSQGSSTKPSSRTSGSYAPLTLLSQGSSAQSFHSSQGSLEQSTPSSGMLFLTHIDTTFKRNKYSIHLACLFLMYQRPLTNYPNLNIPVQVCLLCLIMEG